MIYKSEQILGSYLAGLWEGDGNVNIRTGRKPTIHITFHKKEGPLVQKLLTIITNKCNKAKVGSIHYQQKRLACYLNIYSIEGLEYVVYLINGKLRTPKAYQIDIIIDWLNEKYKKNIKKLLISRVPLSEDAWLAGFIDADGSFAIRQTLKSKIIKKQTECQFILVQRTVYPKTKECYIEILSLIASFLCVKLKILKPRNPNACDQYKIKASSIKSKAILRRYLDKHLLLTSKLLNYRAWCAADDLMIQKQHYTEQGITKITKIKSSMNNSRVYYNWDHLNLF